MAEYAPPPGPPPPHVPEGWKAVWNTQYNEWFYVNIHTKQSQWEKPTAPAYPPGEVPPPGAPPNYSAPSAHGAVSGVSTGGSDKSGLGSNNPYANISEDEKLARKLQEEEEARVRGASNDYYNQSSQSYPPQHGGYGQPSSSPFPQGQYQDAQTQERSGKSKGFLGKLLGKASGASHSPAPGYQQQQYGHGQPAYGQPAGGYYGGGGYARPMGGGMMPMGGGRRPGGGMGGMALGAGGGLLAGGLIGSAMAADGGDTYIENNYGDDGGDMGGDMGDDMGGDMGGDF